MRRVLMIVNEFPPLWGGGVPRPFAFARYLPQHGWVPTVLTLDPAYYDLSLGSDTKKLSFLPPEVQLLRTRAWRPPARQSSPGTLTGPTSPGPVRLNVLARIRRVVRNLMIFPDKDMSWYPPAVQAGRRVLARERFDLIWSSSPPVSTHVIAYALARRSRLPWVVDFRDPLPLESAAPLLRQRLHNTVVRRVARRTLTAAAAAVITAPTFEAELRPLAPKTLPFFVLENGYDPADFVNIPRPALPPDRLHFGYIGSLLENQKPSSVLAQGILQALATLRHRGIPANFHMIGPLQEDFRRLLATSPDVVLHGSRPHHEALGYAVTCDVNVLIVTANVARNYPGKLFEYLAAQRPLVSLVARGSLLDTFARQEGLGPVGDVSDTGAIAATLLQAGEQAWHHHLAAPPTSLLTRFNRQEQTKRLAALFDQVTRGTLHSPPT